MRCREKVGKYVEQMSDVIGSCSIRLDSFIDPWWDPNGCKALGRGDFRPGRSFGGAVAVRGRSLRRCLHGFLSSLRCSSLTIVRRGARFASFIALSRHRVLRRSTRRDPPILGKGQRGVFPGK
jgi:hypothetical protein